MARSLDNPDPNFSTNRHADEDLEVLRHALHSEPALPFNEAAQLRIGTVISNAVLPSRIRAPLRRLGPKAPP